MAYDENLAARVRTEVGGAGVIEEKRMFGGLSFLIDGHLAVAVSGRGGLLVRVAADDAAALLAPPEVEPMVMGGRVSRTWLFVSEPLVRTDEGLRVWVERGVATVHELD